MTNITVNVDEKLKTYADKLFTNLGMDTSTAVNIFLRQALWQKGMPFEVNFDPFYMESNLKHLDKIFNDIEKRGFGVAC